MSMFAYEAENLVRSEIERLGSSVSGGGREPDPAQVLEAAAELSAYLPVYQHPLGFLHLDLSALAGMGAARLHLWTDDFLASADPLGRLHDHTWELRSWVLVGELVDHVLEATPDPDGAFVAHRIHYGRQANALETIGGRWRLNEVDARTVRAGSSYQLEPRTVHRTEIPRVPTATLVLPIERGGDGPLVYAPVELGSAEAAPRTRVAPKTAALALLNTAKACR